MTSFRLRVMAQVLPFLLVAPGLVLAQTAPTRGEATAAMKPAAGQPAAAQPGKQAAQFTRQQIDQMLAPIALYPDQLLAQVLMAATYPEQLAEAQQWLNDPGNAALKDEALMQALQSLPWDPSVKSLVAFPQVIAMMTDHMQWTQTLGVAFATQQAQVMERVQELRKLAVKSGRLNKVRQVKFEQKGRVIVIVPAEPDRIFVPVYNPTVVYGAWPDRNFPPVFLPPPRGFVAETIEPGIEFSIGYRVVQPLWGWSVPDWETRRITVNTVEYTRITREARVAPGNVWQHHGPVVLVAPPASRPTAVAVGVPAGTVAPPAAAAVVALPERAAKQPNVIQVKPASTAPATTAQPGTPATPPATTAQPSGTQPGTTPGTPPATTAQPRGAQPGTAPGTTAQPTQPRPGQPPAATAQPSTEKPGQAPSTTAQPSQARPAPGATTPPSSAAQTAPKPGEPAQQGTTERGRDRREAAQPGTSQPGAPKQGQAQPTTGPSDQPAGTKAERTRPGEPQPAARQGATTQPGKNQTKAAEPGVRPAREPEAARPSAGAPERATRTPEQAGTRPAGAAPGQRPEAAGSPPGERPAARPPASAQRPAPPHEAGGAQGTSTQGTSAPPQRGPSAGPQQQRGPEPGAAPQQRPREPAAGGRQEGGEQAR